jgi:hypothetical protein
MSIKNLTEGGAFAREVTQGIALLMLTGSSVGGFLGVVAIATKAL